MLQNLRQWLPLILILGVCGAIMFFRNEIMNFVTPSQDVMVASQGDRQVELRSVLPKDAIPSIDNPQFVSVITANTQYDANELVIGVNIDGDARAYSVPLLSRHEIVNDVVGGEPIAVTW
jgi:hypothetical protein